MQTAAVIAFPSTEVLSPIEAGRDAWTAEKAAAGQSRERWRLIGEALLIGRRQHASNQAFGQWCRDEGFSDINARVRSDAIWLAEHPTVFHAVEDSIAHPTHIRAAYNEALKPSAPEPDEDPVPPAPVTQAPAPKRSFAMVRRPSIPEPTAEDRDERVHYGPRTPRPPRPVFNEKLFWASSASSVALQFSSSATILSLSPEISVEEIARDVRTHLLKGDFDREELTRVRDVLTIILNGT